MMNIFFYWLTPMTVTTSTFAVHTLIEGQEMNVEKAFTVLSIFLILSEALRTFP